MMYERSIVKTRKVCIGHADARARPTAAHALGILQDGAVGAEEAAAGRAHDGLFRPGLLVPVHLVDVVLPIG